MFFNLTRDFFFPNFLIIDKYNAYLYYWLGHHSYWICHLKFKEWVGFRKSWKSGEEQEEKIWREKEVVILALNVTGKWDETGLGSNLDYRLIVCKRIHLFNKCLLSTFSVPGSMLGASEKTIRFLEFLSLWNLKVRGHRKWCGEYIVMNLLKKGAHDIIG